MHLAAIAITRSALALALSRPSSRLSSVGAPAAACPRLSSRATLLGACCHPLLDSLLRELSLRVTTLCHLRICWPTSLPLWPILRPAPRCVCTPPFLVRAILEKAPPRIPIQKYVEFGALRLVSALQLGRCRSQLTLGHLETTSSPPLHPARLLTLGFLACTALSHEGLVGDVNLFVVALRQWARLNPRKELMMALHRRHCGQLSGHGARRRRWRRVGGELGNVLGAASLVIACAGALR